MKREFDFDLFFGAIGDLNEDKGVSVRRKLDSEIIEFRVKNDSEITSCFLDKQEVLELASLMFRHILDLS